jgi:hypothetical protein
MNELMPVITMLDFFLRSTESHITHTRVITSWCLIFFFYLCFRQDQARFDSTKRSCMKILVCITQESSVFYSFDPSVSLRVISSGPTLHERNIIGARHCLLIWGELTHYRHHAARVTSYVMRLIAHFLCPKTSHVTQCHFNLHCGHVLFYCRLKFLCSSFSYILLVKPNGITLENRLDCSDLHEFGSVPNIRQFRLFDFL